MFGQLKKLCRMLICFGGTLAFNYKLSNPLQQRMSVAAVSSLRMKIGDIPLVFIPADIPVVRFLVISDTHGMEERLFDDLDHFPQNIDVVLHCGDWWSARGSRDRLDRFFAEWIQKVRFNENINAHGPMLIVLRGNHDPGKYKFSQSKAVYVTHSTRLEVHGLTMEIRPYDTCGVLCDDVDVLVSHEPPHGLLDQAYGGEHVGSTRLLASVKESPTKPKVWCFGHIHEARGMMRHRFDSNGTNRESTTVLVNAASENDYRAKQVKSGPVLLHIGRKE
ncbi:calcineurin-like phosphoesterase-like protein [Fragilaria crotonensis]|nr:calcineurin-like phosphoesterase-like protein [Fragilaria crotonensis]